VVRTTVAGLLLALGLGATACTTSSSTAGGAASSAPPSSSVSSSPTSTPSPQRSARWANVLDIPSKTSFALPQRVTPRLRPAANGFRGRVYQARNGESGVAVTLELSDHDLAGFHVLKVLHALASGLRSASGVTRVRLHDVRPVHSQGMTGVDATISVASQDRSKDSYWRVRAMHDARRVVELEALAFLDPGQTRSADVDADFHRLVRSFRA
jgi:hypothetical protein